MDVRVLSTRKSVLLSVGTPVCPYPIAQRRAYGLFTSGLFLKNLRTPLCGCSKNSAVWVARVLGEAGSEGMRGNQV
jgi:hypothetical protein